MTSELLKTPTKMEKLCSVLLQTLDESIFFSELSSYIKDNVQSENLIFYKLKDDSSIKEVSRNGAPVVDGLALSSQKSIINHVIKTKKAYFSNDTSRDPLFSTDQGSTLFKRELCVPLMCEGIIISIILLQSNEEGEFSRDDITSIKELINQIERPLKNLKMYVSIKNLNEALMKKIESKEQEVLEKKMKTEITDALRVKDKEIIHRSEIMSELVSLVKKISATDVNVLITGQPGTGKGLIANKIHCNSLRSQGAFAKLDCSSLNNEQIERELFGEEKLTLNGEHKTKCGLLEVLNNGTLLLEEISFLNNDLQAKLAGFIKEGSFSRVGSTIAQESNVRIVASTTKDLKTMVAEDQFREELFYAIMTVSLEVPALKDRADDIELLANHFLNEGKEISDHKAFSPCVLKTLHEYHWPGNIRELQNVIERAYILSERTVIEEVSLLEDVPRGEEKKEDNSLISMESFLELTLEELERGHICRTLQHLGGNKTKTAKTLGITVKTLYNKLHSYGMIESQKEASLR